MAYKQKSEDLSGIAREMRSHSTNGPGDKKKDTDSSKDYSYIGKETKPSNTSMNVIDNLTGEDQAAAISLSLNRKPVNAQTIAEQKKRNQNN